MPDRYEYRVIGVDRANGDDVLRETKREALVWLRKARKLHPDTPYDEVFVERRPVLDWERVR